MRPKPITIAEVEYTAFSLAKEHMTWDEPIPILGLVILMRLKVVWVSPSLDLEGKISIGDWREREPPYFICSLRIIHLKMEISA